MPVIAGSHVPFPPPAPETARAVSSLRPVDAKRTGHGIVLSLNTDEAVVLDALLQRWERDGLDESTYFEDQAEQRVLWDLTASLEPVTARETFSMHYDELLRKARDALRDANG